MRFIMMSLNALNSGTANFEDDVVICHPSIYEAFKGGLRILNLSGTNTNRRTKGQLELEQELRHEFEG